MLEGSLCNILCISLTRFLLEHDIGMQAIQTLIRHAKLTNVKIWRPTSPDRPLERLACPLIGHTSPGQPKKMLTFNHSEHQEPFV